MKPKAMESYLYKKTCSKMLARYLGLIKIVKIACRTKILNIFYINCQTEYDYDFFLSNADFCLTLMPSATISVYGSSCVRDEDLRTLNLRGTMVPPR